MSYQQTVTEFRTAAKAVNKNGHFDHGRHVDLSQMFDIPYPLIYLYPFNIADGVDPSFIDNNTILLGFWMPDSPDSTNEKREEIIAQMDALSRAFIEEISELKGVRVSNVNREPQYQMYQGTLSGFAARFNYQNFTPCP